MPSGHKRLCPPGRDDVKRHAPAHLMHGDDVIDLGISRVRARLDKSAGRPVRYRQYPRPIARSIALARGRQTAARVKRSSPPTGRPTGPAHRALSAASSRSARRPHPAPARCAARLCDGRRLTGAKHRAPPRAALSGSRVKALSGVALIILDAVRQQFSRPLESCGSSGESPCHYCGERRTASAGDLRKSASPSCQSPPARRWSRPTARQG